jgi:diaminopimelate decarboxylase
MSVTFTTQHAPHPWFSVRENELVISGRKISEISAEVGQTPFYLYDRSVMTSKVQQLKKVLPREITLHYAIKANPMPAVVSHLLSLTDGVDVASAREIKIALEAGASPENISFAGPGKTIADLQLATLSGITIHIESEREIRILKEIAEATGIRPNTAIRVNPDFEIRSSGMKMGGGSKQFGIDAEAIPAILQHFPYEKINFIGFHLYSGSQNLNPESIIQSQLKSVELAVILAEHSKTTVTHLNIGGGFGVPYFPGELPLDLSKLSEHFKNLLASTQKQLPKAKLILELGRFLVAEAGIYVCKVLDRKISRGQVFLVTDGGMHHHLAASGNFGQIIRKNYPVILANHITSEECEIASIVGPLCTPLDLLADRIQIPKAQEGDLVAILQSGAYGMTASPLRFLSHPEPMEIVI